MKEVHDAGRDVPGPDYWERNWQQQGVPEVWGVESPTLGSHGEREVFLEIASLLAENGVVNGASLVEVGCAQSQILPLFSKHLGMEVSGIDYSPTGCEKAALMLRQSGVDGDIHCVDVFSVPEELRGKFDVVISLGLVEHFERTEKIVSALAALLRPGGVMFTGIPNMNGAIGAMQKALDRRIYDIHVPIDCAKLRAAHDAAGLCVLSCRYFMSTGFGVVNIGHDGGISWWVKKVVLALLVRVSIVVWLLERMLGKFPSGKTFSPYVHCLAKKPLI